MGSGIKGFKSQKILKSKINGYTETESIDIERYATIQELTGDKHGVDVVMHGSFKVNTLVCTAEAGSNIRVIKFTAHGASKGDHIRFVDSGIEASILSVPSANELILGSELSFDPTGLDFDIFRHITPKYAKDGGLQVSQGPVQYNDNQVGTPVEVTMDTAVPANIKALPTELIFKKDGVNKRVSYDSTTPTNSDAIPVNIVTVNGTGIQTTVDLTGAQVNVQLSHNASNPDSVQIGDGTDLLQISTDGEALVVVNKELPEGTKKIGKIVITDGVDDAEVKALTTGLVDADKGLVTQSVLHGHYSSGGGGWVDIKATQSGALEVNVNGNSNAGDTLAATHDVVMVGAKDENDVAQMLKIDSTTKGLLVKSSGDTKIGDTIATDHNLIMAGVKNNASKADIMKLSATGNLKVSIEEATTTLKNTIAGISKGTTTVAEATVSIVDADHNALDVKVQDFAAGLKATSGSNTALGTVELSSVLNTPFSTKVITYNAQSVSGLSNYYAKVAASIIHGWDSASSVHKEISVSPTGQVNTTTTQQTVAGTITNAQITVGLTAVRATVSGSAPNAARKKLMIKPSASNTGKIFLGSSSVTIANGLEIIGPDRLEFEFDSGDYYLISDTAAQVVEIIEKA